MAKAKSPIQRVPLGVVITDTHMEEDNIETNRSIYAQARAKAKELKVNKVYHAGDIFDSRKAQPQNVLNAFGEELDLFEADDIEFHAIPGNHDKTDYGSLKSFLEPYRKRPGFYLWSDAVLLEGNADAEIWMIPFFSDALYVEAINGCKIRKGETKKQILITHIGVDGAVMNNGIAVSSKVSKDLFEKFDLVLIGHYHDAQQYSEKIRYIGASCQHNYGESPTKGLTIIYSDATTEFVELDLPHYINYEIDVNKITLEDIKQIKKEKASTKDQIRITLTGSEKDIKAFDATALKALGVDVKKKEDEIKVEEIESRVTAFTDTSILGSFEAFCIKKELNHEQGLKYLQQALGLEINEEEEQDV